jgi:hypothetical protein
MKPITTKIKEIRAKISFPKGMKISIRADGSGGIIPEYNTDPASCKCGKKMACKCKKNIK